jgi:hypothetical protein
MGKKSRLKNRSEAASTSGEVGPRQPCPCGSGKRYKACHGDPSGVAASYVGRPFEGLASECDLIALRELVPAATAPLPLAESVQTDRAVLLCTLLPMAAPALVREDGTVWLALQVQHQFGDPSRELAAVLQKALDAAPGEMVGLTEAPGEGPRLQDLVVADQPLDITVHEGFEFWISDMEDETGALKASLESANDAANPTQRLSSVEAAYWTNVGTKEHLRWAMPHDEEQLLSALARLHVQGKDVIAEGARLVGMFRVHGVLVPVWDLPVGTGAEVLEGPAATFAKELERALADDSPLTSEERAARSGLANRQLTIR